MRFPCGRNLDAATRIQAIQEELTKLPEISLGQIEALLAKIEAERDSVRLPAHKLAGSMRGRLTPLDDFLREKHAAGDRW